MPKFGNKRKKRRTHVVSDDQFHTNQNRSQGSQVEIPKSMIFRRGQVSNNVIQLIDDLRKIFRPYTALRLKERQRNKFRDFLQTAEKLDVTHLINLTQSDIGLNLRMIRLKNGPTLIFRILKYSLISDISKYLKRPLSLSASDLQSQPSVVLKNFGSNLDVNSPAERKTRHLQMLAVMFQNLFPPLNIETIKLSSECRRTILFYYDKEKDVVEVRHFFIKLNSFGLSRPIKRVCRSRLPNLNKLDDISDFILNNESENTFDNCLTSDSEIDDASNNCVELNDNSRKFSKSKQCAVRLKEIGPRMTLQLLKIEEEVNGGRVFYNRYVTKTDEEVANLQKQKDLKKQIKQQFVEQQRKNVERKREQKTKKNIQKASNDNFEDENENFSDLENNEFENSDFDNQSNSENNVESIDSDSIETQNSNNIQNNIIKKTKKRVRFDNSVKNICSSIEENVSDISTNIKIKNKNKPKRKKVKKKQ